MRDFSCLQYVLGLYGKTDIQVYSRLCLLCLWIFLVTSGCEEQYLNAVVPKDTGSVYVCMIYCIRVSL